MSVNDKIPFWSNNPNILLQHMELFPVESMSFEQKLNAITRGIVLLSIIALILSRDIRFLIVMIFTVLAVYLFHEREIDRIKKMTAAEHFENPADLILKRV